ncbi:MAG: hypothetical protein J1G30_00105 [Spirochaetales bacterium]|nr:hypothetical protein [Spirochaetales bacterium]
MRKNLFLFFYFLLFSSFFMYAQSISIGIVNPFLYQNSTETLLIKSNLIFEIFSVDNEGKFSFKNITCKGATFDEWQQNAFSSAEDEDLQYVFLFKTYKLYENIILQSYLFDVEKNQLLYNKNYPIEFNIKINESIAFVAEQIISDIMQLHFDVKEVVKNKSEKKEMTKTDAENTDEQAEKIRIENLLDKERFKHELFVANGFLKMNSGTLTFTSLYTGYSFYASDFIYIDVGGCIGFGKQEKWFDFTEWKWNSFYGGGFAGIHFYLKGWFEPNIGAKVEILYNNTESVCLSVPFDVGMKIHLSKRHLLRISGVFPIMSLNLTNYQWDNKLTLGVLIGYGVKL